SKGWSRILAKAAGQSWPQSRRLFPPTYFLLRSTPASAHAAIILSLKRFYLPCARVSARMLNPKTARPNRHDFEDGRYKGARRRSLLPGHFRRVRRSYAPAARAGTLQPRRRAAAAGGLRTD